MEARWHEYNLGLKPMMKPFRELELRLLAPSCHNGFSNHKLSALFIFQTQSAADTADMALTSMPFDIRSLVTTFLRTESDGFGEGHCKECKPKYMTGVLQDWCNQNTLSERVSSI